MQMALDSLSWAGLNSVDSVLFGRSASVLSDHTHFFSAETCVFDRHADGNLAERKLALRQKQAKIYLVHEYLDLESLRKNSNDRAASMTSQLLGWRHRALVLSRHVHGDPTDDPRYLRYPKAAHHSACIGTIQKVGLRAQHDSTYHLSQVGLDGCAHAEENGFARQTHDRREFENIASVGKAKQLARY
jgi:hypothetical protein